MYAENPERFEGKFKNKVFEFVWPRVEARRKKQIEKKINSTQFGIDVTGQPGFYAKDHLQAGKAVDIPTGSYEEVALERHPEWIDEQTVG